MLPRRRTVDSGIAFAPLNLPERLWGWWKADSSTVGEGGFVTPWSDSSGNGRDLTGTGVGNSPILKLNLQNGLPIVRFIVSSGSYLTTGAQTLAAPYTTYLAVKLPTWNSNARLFEARAGNAGGTLIQQTSSPQLKVHGVAAGPASTDFPLNVFVILACIFNDTTATNSMLQIGNKPQIEATMTISATTTGFIIGENAALTGGYCEMDLGELIIRSGIDRPDVRNRHKRYLSQKWGVPI